MKVESACASCVHEQVCKNKDPLEARLKEIDTKHVMDMPGYVSLITEVKCEFYIANTIDGVLDAFGYTDDE